MDIIKLYPLPGDADTELGQGESVEGWDKVLWVERFQVPGEFKIEAKLSTGLIDFLPLGSFLSHIRSTEIMIVENHEIQQPKDQDPTVIISGRTFTSFPEHRVARDKDVLTGATPNWVTPYQLSAANSWDQVVLIIQDHMITPSDANDDLPGVLVVDTCTGTGTSEARTVKPGQLSDRVQELLKIDDIGIKTIRGVTGSPETVITIYQGEDRSDTVRFSWITGDLDNLEYLFSIKKNKTHAMVMGRWVQTLVADGSFNNYDRRILYVDGSDIDQRLSTYPTAGALTAVVAEMDARGKEALKQHKKKTITQVDVSENAQWQYRRDYNMGDLVSVDGDFGVSAVMRVVEHAEVQDENGTSGHPTLAFPGEN